jgi:distribution and morphology protein 12
MSLPLEATLVVAFEGSNRSIHLSLLDPNPGGGGAGIAGRKESAGNRILKSAVVESEVGQADKHVLKNVGKVEKFVLEVARKTLENEIVFP